jgi:type I restriction enzyme R subunit
MHHRRKGVRPGVEIKTIDIADDGAELKQRKANVREIDMSVYRKQVTEALEELFETSPILQKIRLGQPVSEADLKTLTSLVLTNHPGVDLSVLTEFYEEAQPLDFIIRRIIGMDGAAVKGRFEHFVQRYPRLSSSQILFLNLLQNHISKYGSIDIDRLYEPPFTTVASDGVDGVFTDEAQVAELIHILEDFQPIGVAPHV